MYKALVGIFGYYRVRASSFIVGGRKKTQFMNMIILSFVQKKRESYYQADKNSDTAFDFC